MADCLNNEEQITSNLDSTNQDNLSSELSTGNAITSEINMVSEITSNTSSGEAVESSLTGEEQLASQLDLPVTHTYRGAETDNIVVSVDNNSYTISASLKQIKFKTVADFPVVGSDRLIYIDASNNSLYSWDSATQTYSQLVAGGGGGESYDDTELRNLITGLEESKASKTEVAETLSSAKGYTDTKVAELIDSAPETLDTFKEIADAFKENDAVLDALNSAIGNKADKTALATTDAKVGALETDNATNKANIKELQENKADADDIPTNYVTTDTIQEVTGLKSFNDVQIKGTLIDDAGTKFNSLYEIQPRLKAGRGISIEGNEISSTAESVTVKDQSSIALKPYTGSGTNVTENKDALTERAIATALPYINGSHKYTDAVDIYAPTSSGKTGQILVAKSSTQVFGGWEEKTSGGTPEWKEPSELGLQTIIGANAPISSTVGVVGQYYYASNLDSVYLCVGTSGGYNWKPIGGEIKLNTSDLFNKVYPIGTIYITTSKSATGGGSPASIFGGTWVLLKSGYTLWTASLSDTAGTIVNAGLPNITGTFKADGIRTTCAPTSGAFTNAQGSGRFGAYNPGVDLCENVWTFNANDGATTKGIYGNSTTVQPPAIKVYMWERIS